MPDYNNGRGVTITLCCGRISVMGDTFPARTALSGCGFEYLAGCWSYSCFDNDHSAELATVAEKLRRWGVPVCVVDDDAASERIAAAQARATELAESVEWCDAPELPAELKTHIVVYVGGTRFTVAPMPGRDGQLGITGGYLGTAVPLPAWLTLANDRECRREARAAVIRERSRRWRQMETAQR